MSELEIFEFLEADYEEECRLRRARKRRRMQLRQKSDPFSLSDEEFTNRYRLTKDLTKKLCDELKHLFNNPKKSTDLSVETKVLIALSFYASGSYQSSIGKNEGHSVAQQTVSAAISQVTACLNSREMRQKYIKYPITEQERNIIKTEFFNKFHIPEVLGCIDCNRVAIVRPVHNEDRYFCSKRYHCLNVQFICDANMQITSVDASHGGASPDSSIWAEHPLYSHLENLSKTEDIWFLGDSRYPLSKTILTPIQDAAPDSPEAHYNALHAHTRTTIERTIGLLKARFRCLLADKPLRYSPDAAGYIVNACVILHNICNKAQTPVQLLSDAEVLREAQLQGTTVLETPEAKRAALVQRLWAARQTHV